MQFSYMVSLKDVSFYSPTHVFAGPLYLPLIMVVVPRLSAGWVLLSVSKAVFIRT